MTSAPLNRRPALLLAALSISLAGCGRSEAPEEPRASTVPAAAATAAASAPVDLVVPLPPEQGPSTAAPADAPDEVPAVPPAAAPPPAQSTPPPQAIASGPPAAFASCGGCHSIEQGAPHRMGPNLFGVVGSRAGSQPGYAYSPAMSGADLVWTESSIDAFLAAPREVVPGTRMAAPPVRDAGARRAIVEYLASLK